MVTRVGGLASGMDIDELVKKLMSAEKAPLVKLEQKKQTTEWQRDAYRSVSSKLKTFDTYLSSNMVLPSNLLKKNVSSTNPAVSATGSSSTSGTLSIDKVNQLAKSANAVGSVNAGTDKSQKLSEINANFSGTYNIKLDVLQSDGTMKAEELTFDADETLDSVLTKLNNVNGMNAFYDKASGQIAIAATNTGAGGEYTREVITDGSGPGGTNPSISQEAVNASIYIQDGLDFFKNLGFADDSALANNGQDAELVINGATINRSSNTFDINGFKVTLNSEYQGNNPITLSAQTDVDNMVGKIADFVSKYNDLVKSLNDLTKEQKYRDYKPLTDEQKEDMTEDEIKKWEEKSKSGLLRSDSILRSGIASMRSNLYEVGGSNNPIFDTLYEMGITTSKSYNEGGTLEIDEDKLRKAIEADPEAVMKTFTNLQTDTEKPGLVQNLRASISKFSTDIDKKAGRATEVENSYQLGKSLVDMNKRIDAWKQKLENIESRYWKQFTAMEKAINKANSQGSYFQQQQQQ